MIPQFSKKQKVAIKVTTMLLGISFVSYAIYFAVLMFTFFGETFFMVLSAISVVLAVLFCVLFLFWQNNRKHFLILFIIFTSVVVISVGTSIIYKNYQDNIPKILSANGVDLTGYIPFHGDKVAVLGRPASLEITKDFPVMDGATALYPVYAAFAQAICPELANEEPSLTMNKYIVCNDMPYAYDDLIRSAADMIFVSAPSQKQIDDAKAAGKEFQLTPIGREALVFFVNKKNPISNLTMQQIRDIYSGRVKSWKKVGGKRGRIIAFQRPVGSGSQNAFQNIMKGETIMKSPTRRRVHEGSDSVVGSVADYKNYKNAIGFTFRFFLQKMTGDSRIKILRIDDIAPTMDNITNGSYPLTSDFYAVTAGSGNKNIKRVMDWILSEEGQELIEKAGYVPFGRGTASGKSKEQI